MKTEAEIKLLKKTIFIVLSQRHFIVLKKEERVNGRKFNKALFKRNDKKRQEIIFERKWILWGVWRVMAYEYLFSVSLFIFVSKQSMKILQCLSWKYCVFLGPNIDRHENISIASSRISTSFLRRKKVKSPAKQFKELFSLCPNHFRWNEIVVSEV